MKFLIITQRFHTNLYYRALSLQNAGHTVKVIALYKGQSEFHEHIDIKIINASIISRLLIKTFSGFKKSNLKSSFERRVLSPGKELKQIFKQYKPDVVILKAFQNISALKSLYLAKKFHTKVLMLTQSKYTHIKGSETLFRLNIKLFKFLKLFAYITPIKSNFEAFKNFGIKNVYYLPFVFPEQKHSFQIPRNKIKIISVGKYTKRKAQSALVNAVYNLIKKGHNIELNFFGETSDKNYYRKLTESVRNLNAEHNIHFYENIEYAEILKQYPNHHLYILPSYAEPAAYSIVEASAFGLPVICSSENGTKCYVEDARNGYIFKAKDETDLEEKIETMITNLEILLKFSENSLIFAKEHHNMHLFAEKILQIINTQNK